MDESKGSQRWYCCKFSDLRFEAPPPCFSHLLTMDAWIKACILMFVFGNALTLGLSRLPTAASLLLLLLLLIVFSFRYRRLMPLVFLTLGLLNASHHFAQHKKTLLPRAVERVDTQLPGQVQGLVTNRQGDLSFDFVLDAYGGHDLPTQFRALSGRKIKLNCYRCPLEIRTGERWQFTLRLKRPRGFASPNAFDYEKALFRDQTVARGYLRLKSAQTRLATADHRIATQIDRLRSHLHSELRPSDSFGRAIMTALVIGDKSGFSNNHRDALQAAGLSHLVVISGLHIGLIFALVYFLSNYVLKPFTRLYRFSARQKLALLPALGAALFYAALAGFAVSTQRALIMLGLYCLFRVLSRPQSLMNTLLLTALIVLVLDPFSVLDAGFWLSFYAVFVIAVAHHAIKSQLSLLRLQPLLWISMMPISALFFSQISLLSPLLNLVMVPLFCVVLIPTTLVLVAADLSFSSILPFDVLHWLGLVFDGLLVAIQYVTETPFSVLYLGDSFWLWSSAILVSLILLYRRSLSTKSVLVLLVFALASAVFSLVESRKGAKFELNLLDVGQGLAMVVELDNYVLVYDTGPKYRSGFSAAKAVLLPFLRNKGYKKLDAVVISHADNDHIGGYEVLSQAFAIERLYSSRQDKLPTSMACESGYRWQVKETLFHFISPDRQTPTGSNNRSCVLRIEHAGVVFLITGDIEKAVERDLVARSNHLKADIMLVPHQGSKTSSTDVFLDYVAPKLALVAAGYKNQYGHPHPAVMQRYRERNIEVLSTIDSGTIRLSLEQGELRPQRYRVHSRRFWHD